MGIFDHIMNGSSWVLVLALLFTNRVALSLSRAIKLLVSTSERQVSSGFKTLVWVIESGPYTQQSFNCSLY